MNWEQMFQGFIGSAIFEVIKWGVPALAAFLIKKGINVKNTFRNIVALLAIIAFLYLISLIAGPIVTFILLIGLVLYGAIGLIRVMRDKGLNKLLVGSVFGVTGVMVLILLVAIINLPTTQPPPGDETATPGDETATPDDVVNIRFQDDFSNVDDVHWSLGEFEDPNILDLVEIKDGVMRGQSEFEGQIKWTRLYDNVDNFSYIEEKDFDLLIEAKLIEPTTASDIWISIHFRIGEEFENYALLLNEEQQYALLVNQNGVVTEIVSWTGNEKINPLADGNEIRVIADGLRFTIEVNGEELIDVLDNAIQNSGGFAFGVRANSGSAEVEFDNLLICEGICE